MLSFSKDQEVLEIGRLRLGGQPGECPTALFGTVFYGRKYREPEDDALAEVRGFIQAQEELSRLTGVQAVVDIFMDREEFIASRLELVLGELPADAPISLDVPESELRCKVLEHCSDADLTDRVILNSFNLGAEERELEVLREHPPASAILLGYNPKDLSTDGRLNILETGAGFFEKGLIDLARELGIRNLLLDTGATPFDHSACETLRAIPVFKNKWGLPVGCAIHNTVESWLWMKDYRKGHRETYLTCDAGSNAMSILMGADYSVYGPMRNAGRVFPFVAMVDKFMAEGAEDYFGVQQDEGHPRRKLA
jgi:tetrahydromethanopterin S-methyltransferase subunit H